MYLDFRVDEVEFNQLVEMSLGQEIEVLCNDDFKDSDDKCPVFREAVVGSDTDHTSSRCLVAGATNFECEFGRNTDASLSSNSEKSAVTMHSSTKIYIWRIFIMYLKIAETALLQGVLWTDLLLSRGMMRI